MFVQTELFAVLDKLETKYVRSDKGR